MRGTDGSGSSTSGEESGCRGEVAVESEANEIMRAARTCIPLAAFLRRGSEAKCPEDIIHHPPKLITTAQ